MTYMEQILNNEWGIYKIDFPNGKSYIGQSSNLKRRMNDYKNWKKKCSSQTALYNAFNKYGGFKYETVTFLYKDGGIINKDLLNDLEAKYINEYNTLVPNGYNIRPGGKSSSGYKKQYSLIELKKLEFLTYCEEPILNTETGEVYNNVAEWLNDNKLYQDAYYDLYCIDSKFRFLNEKTLLWNLGSGTIPKNASISDVLNKKAKSYIKV